MARFSPFDRANNTIPAGQYKLTLTEIKAATSRAGEPVVRFRFTVPLPDGKTHKGMYTRSLQESALGMISSDIVNCGAFSREKVREELDADSPEGIASWLQPMLEHGPYDVDVSVTDDRRFNNIRYVPSDKIESASESLF